VKVEVLKVLDVLATRSNEVARQLLVYLTFSKRVYGNVIVGVLPTEGLAIESTEPMSEFKFGRHYWRVYTYPRLLKRELVHSYGVKVNFTHVLKREIMNLREVSLSKLRGKFLVRFNLASEYVVDYDLVLGPMSFEEYNYEVLKGSAIMEEHYDKYSKRRFALLVIKSREGKVRGVLELKTEQKVGLIPVQLHSDDLPENFIPFKVTLEGEEDLEQSSTNRLIMRLPDINLVL